MTPEERRNPEILKASRKRRIASGSGRSVEEVNELKRRGIKVLSRRHIECYLLDDEIIKLLCDKEGKTDKYEEILEAKKRNLENSISRGNAIDDMKSASDGIFSEIKRILQLARGGNTRGAFFRDILAPLITPETRVYQELKSEIFG